MIAALGGVPYELTHERGGVGLEDTKLSLYAASACLTGQEGHLPEPAAGFCQETCGGFPVVALGQVLEAGAEHGARFEVGAFGMP
ncbi:hypothetical protein [Streptomyces syringium]|uniref:hypothetical protein n=1 Tax=Streptomyces syringium TaxID=76729 RepID=UPI0034525083